MKRNRKRRQQGTILPVPFGTIVVMLSALAIGYVWLDCRCAAVGNELAALEKEKAALRNKYLNEQCRWVKTRAPGNIEKAMIRDNIHMILPRPDQVIHLKESGFVQSVLARSRTEAPAAAGAAGVVMNE